MTQERTQQYLPVCTDRGARYQGRRFMTEKYDGVCLFTIKLPIVSTEEQFQIRYELYEKKPQYPTVRACIVKRYDSHNRFFPNNHYKK